MPSDWADPWVDQAANGRTEALVAGRRDGGRSGRRLAVERTGAWPNQHFTQSHRGGSTGPRTARSSRNTTPQPRGRTTSAGKTIGPRATPGEHRAGGGAGRGTTQKLAMAPASQPAGTSSWQHRASRNPAPEAHPTATHQCGGLAGAGTPEAATGPPPGGDRHCAKGSHQRKPHQSGDHRITSGGSATPERGWQRSPRHLQTARRGQPQGLPALHGPGVIDAGTGQTGGSSSIARHGASAPTRRERRDPSDRCPGRTMGSDHQSDQLTQWNKSD